MIPRQVAVEYKVDRAGPDVEREQLNRILEEIKRQIANLGGDVNYVTQQQLQDALDTIVFPPSGGGIVNTVVGGYAISVDSTDPANPIVALDIVGDGNSGDVITSDGAGGISWQPGGGNGPSATRFTVGAVDGNGPILPTSTVYWAQVERDITLSGNWTLMVSPSSSVTIDIRLATFPTIPSAGDSITGGNAPAVVADTNATGDFTGWSTTTLTRGQVIAAVITANTGCRYIDLMLEAS